MKNIISIYEKNNIVKWRNETIGHGSLSFDDTQEFKVDIEEKLRLIKVHFDTCDNDYKNLCFTYVYQQESTLLNGCEFNCKILKP